MQGWVDLVIMGKKMETTTVFKGLRDEGVSVFGSPGSRNLLLQEN